MKSEAPASSDLQAHGDLNRELTRAGVFVTALHEWFDSTPTLRLTSRSSMQLAMRVCCIQMTERIQLGTRTRSESLTQ